MDFKYLFLHLKNNFHLDPNRKIYEEVTDFLHVLPYLLLGAQRKKGYWRGGKIKKTEKTVMQPGLTRNVQTNHPHEMIDQKVRNADMFN